MMNIPNSLIYYPDFTKEDINEYCAANNIQLINFSVKSSLAHQIIDFPSDSKPIKLSNVGNTAITYILDTIFNLNGIYYANSADYAELLKSLSIDITIQIPHDLLIDMIFEELFFNLEKYNVTYTIGI